MRTFILSGSSAERDMENRVRRVEERVNEIERRQDRRAQDLTVPLDLWLESGFEDGGILVVYDDPNVGDRTARRLRRRGYKVVTVQGGAEAMSAFRKASYNLMIVPWVLYERSEELIGLLRKAFPQTRIIITSPRFAWTSENMVGAKLGSDALEAGAFSYIPDQHIIRNIVTCVETAMKSNERACSVLMKGLPCDLRCAL